MVMCLFVILITFIILYCNYLERKYNRCIDKLGHIWSFTSNSKGSTGDLGFGIRNNWDIDYYYCTKCGKEKEVEK